MVAGEWINGNLQEVYGAEEREGPTRRGMVAPLAEEPKSFTRGGWRLTGS